MYRTQTLCSRYNRLFIIRDYIRFELKGSITKRIIQFDHSLASLELYYANALHYREIGINAKKFT